MPSPTFGHSSSSAEAIFFRKSDGTPWVKWYEEGYSVLSPVTQLGNMLQWVGREVHPARGAGSSYMTYTVWADGANHLSGAEGSPIISTNATAYSTTMGGAVDLTCAAEALPTVIYNNLFAQTQVTPPRDPP